MQKIFLLDNFDSFTFNLVHYFESLDCAVVVQRNNEPLPDLLDFDKIVISPGPGLPSEAGRLMELLEKNNGQIPVLGVCLGMQAIAEYLGGKLYNQNVVKHGIQTSIKEWKPNSLMKSDWVGEKVGLYHSWAVDDSGDYEITTVSEDDIIMSIENSKQNLFGVQFHPESILTKRGMEIVKNFVIL